MTFSPSDLIKKANHWFNENPDWQIVNCETVLIFFTCENGLWNLKSDGSCFTLDNGQQSVLFALRLWIKRSLAKQNSQDYSPHSSTRGHPSNAHHLNHIHHSSQTNQIHHPNHHTNPHTNHHVQHVDHTRKSSTHHSTNRSQSHHSKQSRPSISPLPDADPNNNRSAAFTLKYRDFVPDNPEPGNHYTYEKLDAVIDKLNLAILNGELNAEDICTVETLYYPVDCDFILDSRLELTLHSFPSSYVCILRVFYVERKGPKRMPHKPNGSNANLTTDQLEANRFGEENGEKNGENNGEQSENEILKLKPKPLDESDSLTGKLRRLGYAFKIQIKDFIPKTLNRGTFFKRPEFEQLSACIQRASRFIEDESAAHQLRHQHLMGDLQMENHDFLFDFKNAQSIEIKTKILKHNIDSRVMAHTTDSGDYIRIFRVAYMQVYKLKEKPETAKTAMVSKLPNLLTKSRQLIKSAQFSKSFSFSQTDSQDESLLNLSGGSGQNDEEEKSKTIHLTSIIFTPTDSVTTISEMKRKIQNYTLTRCRDDQTDQSDELAKYSRKPRLLSAETVEIYTRNFSSEEIEKETENCFQFNRLGTMNNFLYFSFRIYLDDANSQDGSGLISEFNNRNDRLTTSLKRNSTAQNRSAIKDKSTCAIL